MRPPFPVTPDHVFASMGNYMFSTRTLLKALREDAEDEDSSHDFGRDILPWLVARKQPIYAYDFQTNNIPGEPPDQPPTGATWEPSTPIGKPTWTCAPSSRP